MKRVLFIFGTRPEAIKLVPVIKTFQKDKKLDVRVVLTGQHKQMLDQVMRGFKIRAHKNLHIMLKDQTLFDITCNALKKIENLYKTMRPDIVFVQGDTTTAFACALGAFYARIPVAHVEAGLRSWDLHNPYPEELNRIYIDKITSLHFAATPLAKKNLLKEGANSKGVVVTGNTVIDALFEALQLRKPLKDPRLACHPELDSGSPLSQFPKNIKKTLKHVRNDIGVKTKIILLTAHRRENFGKPLKEICKAVLALTKRFPETLFIYPVHMNPNVKKIVYKYLSKNKQVLLCDPLDYFDLLAVMKRSHLILTDSGGIQEEAPSLGKPVLILRKVTERPEAAQAGCSKIIGELTDSRIVRETSKLLTNKTLYNKMSRVKNPFGDGRASQRILSATKRFLSV
ncbi:non-hydrolyzing UDP-N-acetylglucosamine 2-epimerase [Elusimicrobiota bacterium]